MGGLALLEPLLQVLVAGSGGRAGGRQVDCAGPEEAAVLMCWCWCW